MFSFFLSFHLEICLRYNWEKPVYQAMQSPVDQEGKKTFLFRVTIMQLGITIQVNLHRLKFIKNRFNNIFTDIYV